MFVCFRTFCFIIVKLKHEYRTIEDWKAPQTNTDTVKRQRWGQGSWSRDVGGDSASSAGERQLSTTLSTAGCMLTSTGMLAFLRAAIRDGSLSFVFILFFCLNTGTRTIHHGRKHTENFDTSTTDRPARRIGSETRKRRNSEQVGEERRKKERKRG